jgi:pyruvate formate lyase activating enzyme
MATSAIGLACLAGGAGAAVYRLRRSRSAVGGDVFHADAPQGPLWDQWQRRGWVREALHYRKLGRNVHCKLCPNQCLLEPEDRSHCRNRVNKDGTLYTLAYGNPCAFHLDPVEKKPLFHFLPDSAAFSLATAGCVFRCLNCQNWDISQRKPEETKSADGPPLRLTPDEIRRLDRAALGRALGSSPDRLSLFPDDVVALAERLGAASIAYTYSEPIAYYEYMLDTARRARQRGVKNLWITCGSIQEQPLVELCRVIDAANVNLKSYDEEVYHRLNAGALEPILRTLRVLKREGVWLEVTNLVVPTYTDKLDLIRRMCDWLVEALGPDVPLHFSRFHPEHKLTHLPPTPEPVLVAAREAARQCGLRYVYVGNARGIDDAETTFCPHCRRAVVQRDVFSVRSTEIEGGKCKSCGTLIAGVWGAG